METWQGRAGLRLDSVPMSSFSPQKPFFGMDIILRIVMNIPKSGEMKTEIAALSFDPFNQRVEIASGSIENIK